MRAARTRPDRAAVTSWPPGVRAGWGDVAVPCPPRAPGRHRPWSPGDGGSAAPRTAPGGRRWRSTLRCRTATTRPSSSLARTSTPSPTRSTTGARMNTPCTGLSPRTGTVTSASKESSCRPKALRLTVMSSSGKTGSSPSLMWDASRIMPAQVPSIGTPSLGQLEDGPAQPPALDELAHGRQFAARQDEAGEACEVRGQAHADRLHADRIQQAGVLGEGALDAEDSDPHLRAPVIVTVIRAWVAGPTSLGRRDAPPPARMRRSCLSWAHRGRATPPRRCGRPRSGWWPARWPWPSWPDPPT